MGRPLKNYDTYIEKLFLYAEACEITIEYRDYPGDGAYIPNKRKVVLDKDLPESTEIATLVHELGHSMDDCFHNKRTETVMDRAYKAFYANQASKKQIEKVVSCEKRAWEFGRAIAKKLRIPLGKWFEEEEKSGLEGYKSWLN